MPYSAEISRGNPACFVFLIDQSGSMGEQIAGQAGRKADFVADVVNRTLHDLVIRCTKTEEILNRFHLAVIGYGARVQPAFAGPLAGRRLVPISEVADNPARVDSRVKKVSDGAGGLVDQQVKFPVWIDPTNNGGTPMCEALALVRSTLEEWVRTHPDSFPPTVLHLTDGESTDGDPSDQGRQIAGIATTDGTTLLFNCHVSAKSQAKVEYPADGSALPDELARMLFSISSPLPSQFLGAAKELGVNAVEGSRGFVFNGDAVSVAQFFDVGTRPGNR